MSEWVISDTHWGHANIIKYCRRPFDSVYRMDEYMIQKWNSVVEPGDTVYHLGDFCFCKKDKSYEEIAMDYLSKLNGRVILVLGNHDRDMGVMRRCGFSEVHEKLILDREDTKLIMSHRRLTDLPTINCSVEVHGYTPFPLPTTQQWVQLSGHVHDKWLLKFGGIEVDKYDKNYKLPEPDKN